VWEGLGSGLFGKDDDDMVSGSSILLVPYSLFL
jgi:hypothetical protein